MKTLADGSVVLGLSGLIWTSRSYHSGRVDDWLVANGVYAVGLMAFTFAGSLTHSPGVMNTATVFACLWFASRCGEHVTAVPALLWPMSLAGSVALWFVTLFLRAHPGFLYSLVTVCAVDER